MDKVLVLLRGVPGSGKSTEARRLMSGCEGKSAHYEADQYFMVNGVYNFNPAKLPEAHGQCQAKTRAALEDPSVEMVVVSNTFIRAWELQPYFDMAAELGTKVIVRRMTNIYANAHGVPEDRVRAMLSAMEDIPGEELVGA